MSETPAHDDTAGLAEADDRALKVPQYEQIEQRVLGRTWTLSELAVGFIKDAAYFGHLMLAADHTWASTVRR